jgi:hypothetical protein
MEFLELTRLCTACKGIFALERSTHKERSRVFHPTRGQHAFALLQTPSPTHHGVKALQASSESGCQLCILLWGQMHPRDRVALLRSVASSSKDISCQTHVERSPICLRVSFSYDGLESGPHAQTTFNLYRMKGKAFLPKTGTLPAYTRRHWPDMSTATFSE